MGESRCVLRATSAYKLHRLVRGPISARGCGMSKGDAFSSEFRRRGFSNPPTQRQVDQLYEDLESRLLDAVADFGVDELHQVLQAAKAIRARRSS